MMRRTPIVVVLIALLSSAARAAPPADEKLENTEQEHPEKYDHRWQAGVITAGAYAALYGWVTLAWYIRTEDSPTFHVHDEGWFGKDTYAGGADKLGHFWGNYAMTRGVSQVLRWGGYNKTGSTLIAGGMALTFFTFSEIKDGYKKEYGFSWSDMTANTLGALSGIAFEMFPELDKRFDIRISYLPSQAYLDRLGEDGPFNTPEDYTGQTFLVDYHLGSIGPLVDRASFTKYIDLAVGFQATNYKPMPVDSSPREQALFVGASLNLQSVLDTWTKHRVVHFVTEMYQVPFTTLRMGELER